MEEESPADAPAPAPAFDWGEPTEALLAGGVELRLPVSMIEELESLSDVLSLDTWQNVLSEAEREELRAHLPAGGAEPAALEALLGGLNVNFGNPVVDAWAAVRAGSFQPRVARYRAALDKLRQTAHHHLVREAHNRTVNSLTEARELWVQTLPAEATLERRLEVLRTFRATGERPAPPPAQTTPEKPPVAKKQRTVKAVAVPCFLDALRCALCVGGSSSRASPPSLAAALSLPQPLVDSALRFLTRADAPGPFVRQHSESEWEWVCGGSGDVEHWWRYDLHGPPAPSHGESEQLACAEAAFAEWLRAQEAAPAV